MFEKIKESIGVFVIMQVPLTNDLLQVLIDDIEVLICKDSGAKSPEEQELAQLFAESASLAGSNLGFYCISQNIKMKDFCSCLENFVKREMNIDFSANLASVVEVREKIADLSGEEIYRKYR